MKNITIILSLWLTMCAPVNVQALNRSRTEFLLPMRLYGEHLIVVQGGLGGLPEQHLLVDTGAYPSAIDSDVAHRLKLKVNPGESRALGRNIPAGAAIISQVEIGPVRAQGLPVVVEDLSKLSADLGVRVDALIGLDVLARASFRIDYQGKEMSFGAPVEFPFSVPIESNLAMACVGMTVNGQIVHLLVDTGAAKTVLFTQRVPWLLAAQRSEISFTSLSGKLRLNKVRLQQVDLGGAKIVADDIYLSDGANMAGLPFDGIMATWGGHFRRIAFDFENNLFSWDIDPAFQPARPIPNTEVATSRSEAEPTSSSAGSTADVQQDALRGSGLEAH